jgi:hypothetical protein
MALQTDCILGIMTLPPPKERRRGGKGGAEETISKMETRKKSMNDREKFVQNYWVFGL